MKSQALFFLMLLACMYLTLAQGSYGNCCLGYVKTMRPNVKRNILSYRMQETDGDCNIRAVVFLMRRKIKENKPRTVCANPDHQWVRDQIEFLNQRMKN